MPDLGVVNIDKGDRNMYIRIVQDYRPLNEGKVRVQAQAYPVWLRGEGCSWGEGCGWGVDGTVSGVPVGS